MPSRADLYRFHSTPFDTLGAWFLDGIFMCFTLEDEFREVKVPGETRFPAGEYSLILEESPKFSQKRDAAGNLVYGHDMLTISGVKNYLGLRVHMGVDETHTDGCLLVGNQAIAGFEGHKCRLADSKGAYWRVYPQFAKAIRENNGKIPFGVHDEPFFMASTRIPVLGPVSSRLLWHVHGDAHRGGHLCRPGPDRGNSRTRVRA